MLQGQGHADMPPLQSTVVRCCGGVHWKEGDGAQSPPAAAAPMAAAAAAAAAPLAAEAPAADLAGCPNGQCSGAAMEQAAGAAAAVAAGRAASPKRALWGAPSGVEQQQVSSAAPRRLRLWGPVGEMSVGGVRRRGSC